MNFDSLKQGKVSIIRCRDSAMNGVIPIDSKVIIGPTNPTYLSLRDVVLVASGDKFLLRIVMEKDAERLKLQDGKGKVYGWVPYKNILGLVIFFS